MKTYIVGGAVRDGLLGLPVQDRDHVVVGATPEEMLKQGYTPVGKDFPVFLHPVTHEEYALARTERKTAPGYKGFVFHTAAEVTLEQDLIRRDLTINAMARAEDGSLIDPYGGRQDLEARLFRHVSPAFAEDPLRILRVARFAARFADFTVAPQTNALMKQMVEAGEVDALVPERVWQELARGLMEEKPSRMFDVLRECDALKRILPELDAAWRAPLEESTPDASNAGAYTMKVIDFAARARQALPIRFAALTHRLGTAARVAAASQAAWPGQSGLETHNVEQVEAVCKRLKTPADCKDLAVMAAREQGNITRALALTAEAVVFLLERCDAFRKPQRFIDMLHAAECAYRVSRVGAGSSGQPFMQAQHLQAALAAAQSVNAGKIAQEVSGRFPGQPQKIAEAVRAARIAAVSPLSEKKLLPK